MQGVGHHASAPLSVQTGDDCPAAQNQGALVGTRSGFDGTYGNLRAVRPRLTMTRAQDTVSPRSLYDPESIGAMMANQSSFLKTTSYPIGDATISHVLKGLVAAIASSRCRDAPA